ncbi:MAG TPA: agmatine deiminase family protein [Candidatus Sulfotelmatobacter sp.]|nr:agmatine deiminase family protein [Candidatus Sulfotelmatobacter sp.]
MTRPRRSKGGEELTDLSPSALGYRMPAEWEPHAATWLAWPHFQGDWPGKFEPIPWVYAEIIRALTRHERVELIVNDAASARRARRILERAEAWSENVRFHHWPTNRVWLRDSGCIYLTSANGKSAAGTGHGEDSRERLSPQRALKFRFNAWAKYSNWRLDDKIGSLMARVKAPAFSRTKGERRMERLDDEHAVEIQPVSAGKRIVLEGGSIDVNGKGTILTTEECLLSKVQERNPHMTRVHYEKAFADYLGAPHTIWLGRGIFGDDTHGHVDDLSRFVSKDTVVTMVEPNAKDVNHSPLRANLRKLQAARDQDGRQLTVVELPMPQPVIFEGRRLPSSYANFYIANGVVLAPVFNRPNDRIALNTLAQLFPTREIVPIYSGDFIWGLGAMHCMTQQQPATSADS